MARRADGSPPVPRAERYVPPALRQQSEAARASLPPPPYHSAVPSNGGGGFPRNLGVRRSERDAPPALRTPSQQPEAALAPSAPLHHHSSAPSDGGGWNLRNLGATSSQRMALQQERSSVSPNLHPSSAAGYVPPHRRSSLSIIRKEMSKEEANAPELQLHTPKRRVLPWDVITMIIRRLPVNTLPASSRWLLISESFPRPALFVPGAESHSLYYPTLYKLKGEKMVTLEVAGQSFHVHTPVKISWNMGIPDGSDVAPRLVGGHPSHPIFVHDESIILTCIDHRVHHVKKLYLPCSEGQIVSRASLSGTFMSSDPMHSRADVILLLATDTHLYSRKVFDDSSLWSIKSVEKVIHGRVIDMVFSSNNWFLMDELTNLYRVSFTHDLLSEVEQVMCGTLPTDFGRQPKRCWLMTWPNERVACLSFEARAAEGPDGHDLRFSGYRLHLLQVSEDTGEEYWRKIHYLHACSVFPNWIEGGVAFSCEYPKRWGLEKEYVYHVDLKRYDIVDQDFTENLTVPRSDWPFAMWLFQGFPAGYAR